MESGNAGFRAELNGEDSTPIIENLKAPQTLNEQKVTVDQLSPDELFSDVEEGEIPALTQSFIIEKSRQDRVVEMGTIANEMYTTRKVSRGQMVSMESIGRELLLKTGENAPEASHVIVTDHEVNMYTEQPSGVEVETAIDNTQAGMDRVVADVRGSALALGQQLLDAACKDRVTRTEALYKNISVFNHAVAGFLKDTSSDSLEQVNLRFKRDVNWGNLMAIDLYSIIGHAGNSEHTEDNVDFVVKALEGTRAEMLVKELHTFLTENVLAPLVIKNFVLGSNIIICNADDAPGSSNGIKKDGKVDSFTIGELFRALGSFRFSAFYTNLCGIIDTQATATKSTLELLNGETKMEAIMALSSELNAQHKTIMTANANLGIMCRVQKLIVDFLKQY